MPYVMPYGLPYVMLFVMCFVMLFPVCKKRVRLCFLFPPRLLEKNFMTT